MSFMSKIKSAVTSNTARNIETVGILGTILYTAFSSKIDPQNAAGVKTAFVVGMAAGAVGTYATNAIAGTEHDATWNSWRAGAVAVVAYRATKFINPDITVSLIDVVGDTGEFIGDVVSDTVGVIA